MYSKQYHRFTLNSLYCTDDNVIKIEPITGEPITGEPKQIFEPFIGKNSNTNFINDGGDQRFSENVESLSTILLNIHKQKLLKNLQGNISIENKLQLIKNIEFLDYNKVKIFDIFAGGLMENSDFSFIESD